MDIKKNDIYTMVIEDFGSEGEGIGKVDGFTLFVKDALIGDEIEVKVIKTKKNYGYGRLMKIIKPSPFRVEARCKNARACGGCQIQHLSYEKQLEYKQTKVENLLKRVGKIENYEMLPIIGMKEPYYYRNKAQFPVGKNKDGEIVTGFYAGRTHAIIDTEHCYIQHPLNEQLVRCVKQWMVQNHIEPYDETTGQGLVRHILTRIGFKTKEVMVCLVINGKKLPKAEKLIELLKDIPGMTSISININQEKTNVILGRQVVTLWGRDYIEDYIGDVKFRISPLSFYQVNPVQTQVLYGKALEFADLKGNETVWDLYCGIGTISLFLAKNAAKVYGVEIVPQAIDDAKKNAEINHIENAQFFVGKSEEILPEMYARTKERADVIVVDPPRKGCDESLLECITWMQPDKVVYVSCDPATLARDLKYMEEHGYKVQKVQCVDMFGHSVHVESVVLMSKVEK
ncbi:MAG: 23S rRNA (uracil(1939)-C(5))-methyltransferase RlmD [Lachnospiraceae bacterium]|nr:23S rRNA (uracil(1939)-C(5))-methyltransferase RlmD [Lachnospiraceae bacterium]